MATHLKRHSICLTNLLCDMDNSKQKQYEQLCNQRQALLKEIHEKEQEIMRIDYLKHQIKSTKEQ